MNNNYISRVILEAPINKKSYVSSLPAVKALEKNGALEISKKVTFFVGENGTGKSTLLEAIAVAFGFNAEGGSINFTFSTKDSHSELHKHLILQKKAFPRDGFFLRAESFYNVATNLEDLDEQPAASPKLIESYGGVSLHAQSHGESFMSLVENRFGGEGIYILDEPEAALSPVRQMSLLYQIDHLVNRGSQFIIATHSPILMAYPNADIYKLSSSGITCVPYKETNHYVVYKKFLDHPEKMLKYLLEK